MCEMIRKAMGVGIRPWEHGQYAKRHRSRVGNLLPLKSHLDPFTTARRPMRATVILRSIGHKCFPKKKKKVFTCS